MQFIKSELTDVVNQEELSKLIFKKYSIYKIDFLGEKHCFIYLEEVKNEEDEIARLRAELVKYKQYVLELDRELQTGESQHELQHDNNLQRD